MIVVVVVVVVVRVGEKFLVGSDTRQKTAYISMAPYARTSGFGP